MDINDYKYWGIIGTDQKSPNDIDWRDAYTTFKETRDAHFKGLNEYFLTSMTMINLEDRPALLSKYDIFFEKGRVFRPIAEEFWNSLVSLPVSFEVGDKFTVSGAVPAEVVTQDYPSNDGKKSQEVAQVASENKKLEVVESVEKVEAVKTTQWAYLSEEGEYTYTIFTEELYNQYTEALSELMLSEKELFILIDGDTFEDYGTTTTTSTTTLAPFVITLQMQLYLSSFARSMDDMYASLDVMISDYTEGNYTSFLTLRNDHLASPSDKKLEKDYKEISSQFFSKYDTYNTLNGIELSIDQLLNNSINLPISISTYLSDIVSYRVDYDATLQVIMDNDILNASTLQFTGPGSKILDTYTTVKQVRDSAELYIMENDKLEVIQKQSLSENDADLLAQGHGYTDLKNMVDMVNLYNQAYDYYYYSLTDSNESPLYIFKIESFYKYIDLYNGLNLLDLPFEVNSLMLSDISSISGIVSSIHTKFDGYINETTDGDYTSYETFMTDYNHLLELKDDITLTPQQMKDLMRDLVRMSQVFDVFKRYLINNNWYTSYPSLETSELEIETLLSNHYNKVPVEIKPLLSDISLGRSDYHHSIVGLQKVLDKVNGELNTTYSTVAELISAYGQFISEDEKLRLIEISIKSDPDADRDLLAQGYGYTNFLKMREDVDTLSIGYQLYLDIVEKDDDLFPVYYHDSLIRYVKLINELILFAPTTTTTSTTTTTTTPPFVISGSMSVLLGEFLINKDDLYVDLDSLTNDVSGGEYTSFNDLRTQYLIDYVPVVNGDTLGSEPLNTMVISWYNSVITYYAQAIKHLLGERKFADKHKALELNWERTFMRLEITERQIEELLSSSYNLPSNITTYLSGATSSRGLYDIHLTDILETDKLNNYGWSNRYVTIADLKTASESYSTELDKLVSIHDDPNFNNEELTYADSLAQGFGYLGFQDMIDAVNEFEDAVIYYSEICDEEVELVGWFGSIGRIRNMPRVYVVDIKTIKYFYIDSMYKYIDLYNGLASYDQTTTTTTTTEAPTTTTTTTEAPTTTTTTTSAILNFLGGYHRIEKGWFDFPYTFEVTNLVVDGQTINLEDYSLPNTLTINSINDLVVSAPHNFTSEVGTNDSHYSYQEYDSNGEQIPRVTTTAYVQNVSDWLTNLIQQVNPNYIFVDDMKRISIPNGSTFTIGINSSRNLSYYQGTGYSNNNYKYGTQNGEVYFSIGSNIQSDGSNDYKYFYNVI